MKMRILRKVFYYSCLVEREKISQTLGGENLGKYEVVPEISTINLFQELNSFIVKPMTETWLKLINCNFIFSAGKIFPEC